MSKKILIDGLYNEIRVVLCHDKSVSEFYYKNNVHNQKKGNIHLGKIERIEGSLQAAFVNYGNNKNGFLPFSEIHPINYQIPHKEKEYLCSMINSMRKDIANNNMEIDEDKDGVKFSNKLEYMIYSEICKKYKIHEILKKEQSILVQILKEERGSKGATLSTYISMQGRYSIFLPNSNKFGGISRNVSEPQEKERLGKLAMELREKYEDSAVIIRDSSMFKTKTEIRRDFNHLVRIWENIKENSKTAKAPSFIYEEGDIITKVIRDLYDSDIEEIIVAGEKAYQDTLRFMQTVLPRHVDKIKQYSESEPIFVKYGLEQQINQLYINKVLLNSGGYIVIDQTEALTAIDVNSGRSSGGNSIEDTAFRTNLEAAKEIAKQIKLRDLSGLIVIDFIDMHSSENKGNIENTMKLALEKDPARTQHSKISEFGLMEMTRQRLQNSIYEANFITCFTCSGRGKMRAIGVTANTILRAIETEAGLEDGPIIEVSSNTDVVLYILNNKRAELQEIEKKHSLIVKLVIDEKSGYDGFFIEHKKHDDGKLDEAISTIDDYFHVINPNNTLNQSENLNENLNLNIPDIKNNKNVEKHENNKQRNHLNFDEKEKKDRNNHVRNSHNRNNTNTKPHIRQENHKKVYNNDEKNLQENSKNGQENNVNKHLYKKHSVEKKHTEYQKKNSEHESIKNNKTADYIEKVDHKYDHQKVENKTKDKDEKKSILQSFWKKLID